MKIFKNPKNCRQQSMRALLGTCGLVLLPLATSNAFAQEASAAQGAASDQSDEGTEDIIVTGSQIARSGFDTPTPVTVLSVADFERVGAPNIADALNQLPALKPSITPSATTNLSKLAGANYLDLRGLGYLRTLTLIDGKRYVPSSPEGVVNVNVIPQSVIGSVEVVTGGASAAYGSDAVAGVVNFRLDHKLQGVRGSVQYGVSDFGDHKNYLGSVAYGTKFGDDRGHLLLGAEMAENKGISRVSRRPWADHSVINNPAYTLTNDESAYILVDNARLSDSAYGGVINSVLGGNPAGLVGTEFLAGGQTRRFDYGTMQSGNTQNGGTGVASTSDLVLEQPYKRWAAFGGAEFEFSPAATAYGSFSYGHSKLRGDSIVGNDQITIQRDNVFIPAAVRTVLEANPGVTGFTMGRTLNDYGRGYFDQKAWAWTAIAGVRGDISDTWSYDLSYAYGKSRNKTIFAGTRITQAWRDAVDAIDNPATLGVVDPICRTTITNPGNGCIPLNLFGPIAPGEQAAAIANILAPSLRDWHQTQQSADLIIRGELFQLPAGPFSIAAGVHWRKFSTDVRSDPLSSSRTPTGGTFLRVGNTLPFSGEEVVKEGFGEVLVPILADSSLGKRLELDIAGRITNYKTSGQVETWKVGINYELNDAIRFRATRSRDIRAPNLQELFAAGQTLVFTVIDRARQVPNLNGVIAPDSYTAATISGGNRNLKPERADTFTAGIVLSPAPRVRASLDYYNIKIDGAISTLGSGAILDQCLNGNATICSLITREASTNGTSPGRITNILLAPANVAGINTEGLDFEAAYSFPLGNGTFAIRQLATYLMKLDLIGAQGDVTKLAGNMAQVAIDGPSGTSRLRTSTILEFNNDKFRVSATGRYVSGGLVTRDIDVDKPEVPITSPNKINGRFYLDLAGEVTVYRPGGEGRVAVFGAILNALNKMPPITGYDEYAAPRQLFDVIGRQFTAGIRFNF